jgi:cysteine-rich repeat protein
MKTVIGLAGALGATLGALVLAGSMTTARAQLAPGHIVIADQQYGDSTNGFRGGLFLVKASGARSLLSDFNNAAQGPLGSGGPVAISGIVVESAGTVLVSDRASGTGNRGQVFRVDASGMRSVLTDFGNAAQGPIAAQPTGIALEANGNVLVAALQINGTFPFGVLFRVNPATGNRTVLSDFNDAALGPQSNNPYDLAVEANGRVLVIDLNAGTSALGALFRVNQNTGRRTLLSDFGDMSQGQLGMDPTGVAVDSTGGIWVVDQRGGLINPNIGILLRVDPTTGFRTLASDFSDSLTGPTGRLPTGVTVDAADRILVVDNTSSVNGFSGSLFRVTPATGVRELRNDFGVSAPLGQTANSLVAFAACGDGNPDLTEECDDGNTLNGDGCSDMCKVEPGFVACAKRIATWVGTDGDDTIVGSDGADVIHGKGGNDTLYGSAGRDVICGGSGNDTIRGGSSNDVMEGGGGNDVLIGGNGKDSIKGDAGDDLMRGGYNSDTCNGGGHIAGDTAIDCENVFNVP